MGCGDDDRSVGEMSTASCGSGCWELGWAYDAVTRERARGERVMARDAGVAGLAGVEGRTGRLMAGGGNEGSAANGCFVGVDMQYREG